MGDKICNPCLVKSSGYLPKLRPFNTQWPLYVSLSISLLSFSERTATKRGNFVLKGQYLLDLTHLDVFNLKVTLCKGGIITTRKTCFNILRQTHFWRAYDVIPLIANNFYWWWIPHYTDVLQILCWRTVLAFLICAFPPFHSQVIFGKSGGPEFLHEVYTPVTYHNKQVHIYCVALYCLWPYFL